MVEHDAVARHQIGGLLVSPENRAAIEDEVVRAAISQLDIVEGASGFHFRAQHFERVALMYHPDEDAPMLSRLHTFLAPENLDFVVQDSGFPKRSARRRPCIEVC